MQQCYCIFATTLADRLCRADQAAFERFLSMTEPDEPLLEQMIEAATAQNVLPSGSAQQRSRIESETDWDASFGTYGVGDIFGFQFIFTASRHCGEVKYSRAQQAQLTAANAISRLIPEVIIEHLEKMRPVRTRAAFEIVLDAVSSVFTAINLTASLRDRREEVSTLVSLLNSVRTLASNQRAYRRGEHAPAHSPEVQARRLETRRQCVTGPNLIS